MAGMPKALPRKVPLPEKVTRSAFLYLEPGTLGDQADFAQCGSCRMFVLGKGGEKGRCVIHGSRIAVDEDDSCGFYMGGSADPRPVVVASVTPEESGLAGRLVQCHRCRFANAKATICELFVGLNKKMPGAFALDARIDPHGCCNAQTPKANR